MLIFLILEAGAEICQKSRSKFGNGYSREISFEIYWPLAILSIYSWSFYKEIKYSLDYCLFPNFLTLAVKMIWVKILCHKLHFHVIFWWAKFWFIMCQWFLLQNQSFSNFACMFLNPIFFSNLNSHCSNLLDMRNLQEQVFCYQKLFWPFHCLNKLF